VASESPSVFYGLLSGTLQILNLVAESVQTSGAT
jgi:hypothetical protein